MKTLIFDEILSGHHLEYLHYYYIGACERPDEEFVICIPQMEFESKKGKFSWPDVANISFEWLSESDCASILNCSSMKSRRNKATIVAKYAKVTGATKVLLTNFISTIPFLLMTMPQGISVRGIVYRIFLYDTKNSIKSKLRYAIEDFCYRLMAKSKVMDKVFILNDQNSADRLNKKFRTLKFTFLPDPVPQVEMSTVKNIRQQLDIPTGNKVFLHFGGLSKRKGSIDILNAIIESEESVLTEKTFVFAGKIYAEIHDEFYKLVKKAQHKAHILIFDEFCSYEFLYNMCYSCDVILIPYHQTNLSSGLLGYAAVFGKPVIGPSSGLIGYLISKYDMGYCLPHVSTEAISKTFNLLIESHSDKYRVVNDVNQFVEIVLS